jgi:hypothetical protein
METVRVYRAKVRGWEGALAFARMKYHPENPLESTAPYRIQWGEYTKEFASLQRALGVGYLKDRQALIIGPGADPTEAGLLFGAFPELARLHILDWHEPNIDKLEETLTQWAEQQPQYGRVKLHLSDAVNMEDLSTGSIHLVQMNNVLQYVEGIHGPLRKVIYQDSIDLLEEQPQKIFEWGPVPQKIIDIIGEIKRILVPEGYLLTLNTEKSVALSAVLRGLGFTKVQDDIWRRVA